MSSSDLPNQVRDFLLQKTGAKAPAPGEDCVLVGAGLVDSFGLVTLLAEVESKFGVFPNLMDFDPSAYSTLNGLTSIILQALGVAPAPAAGAGSTAAVSTTPTGLPATRVERLTATHPLWPQLPALFRAMFTHFDSVGVQLPLVAGGENLWLKSIENLPDKVFFIAGAVHENALVGFITGQMKMLPAFLGGKWAGDVAYIYVTPEARRQGLATGLVHAAMQWFRERGAASVELQVLSQNAGAHAFWQRHGFVPELVQFRQHLTA
jgi:ribosomal protein S18 acetylase RimI-like enzyme/acyl carrier protein